MLETVARKMMHWQPVLELVAGVPDVEIQQLEPEETETRLLETLTDGI